MSFRTSFGSLALLILISTITYFGISIGGTGGNILTYSRETEILGLKTKLLRVLKQENFEVKNINKILDNYSYSIIVADTSDGIISSNLAVKEKQRVLLAQERLVNKKDVVGPSAIDIPTQTPDIVKRIAQIYYEPFVMTSGGIDPKFTIVFSITVGLLFAALFGLMSSILDHKTGKIEDLTKNIHWDEDEGVFILDYKKKTTRKLQLPEITMDINKELEEEIKHKDEELKKFTQQVKDYRGKVSKLNKELLDDSQRIVDLETVVKKLQYLANLPKENAEMAEILKTRESEIQDLKIALERIGKKEQSEHLTLEDRSEEIKDLKRTIRDLTKKLQEEMAKETREETEKIKELVSEIVNHKSNLSDLRHNLSSSVHEQARLQHELDKTKLVLESVQTQLLEKMEYINSIPNEPDSQREKVQKTIEEKHEKMQEISKLAIELADVRSELTHTRIKFGEKNEEISRLKQDIEDIIDKNQKLDLNRREMKLSGQNQESQIRHLEAKLAQQELLFEKLPKDAIAVKDQIEEFMNSINDKDKEINKLNNFAVNLQEEMESLKKETMQQQEHLDRMSMENITLREEIFSNSQNIFELNKQIEDFTDKEVEFARIDEILNEVKVLKQSINVLNNEKEDILNDKNFFEQELDRTKNNLHNVKSQLSDKSRALNTISKGFESAKQLVAILNKEREGLKEKIDKLSK